MPTIRSHSCSDGRCEVQHSLYRTTHATSNPAMLDIAKESVSYGVSWYSRQNSNHEQVCHDFKFTLEEVLKIVVERCGTEPRAGHCWEIKNKRNERHGHIGHDRDNCRKRHVVRDPLRKSLMATDRYSDELTHPCLRVSAAQVQMTEKKSIRLINFNRYFLSNESKLKGWANEWAKRDECEST